MSAVVVIGAGPIGTCLVERICANAPQLGRGRVLDLHVVDPYPPGAGRSWRATSPTVPGSTTARALIEARQPAPSVRRSIDPLIAGLFAQGECREVSGLLDVRLPDRRLVTRTGAVHDRRFALGPWTAGGIAGFDGPGGIAPLLREADALARTVLAQVAGSWLHAAA
ncbi:FAD/NAD(P)-binding protein [Nonomuraea basaltis]|uniref:FAD/NAD(P)-binding protein n=1 Tax=Nonomuraea basaltis TaxID=2495887 RepID=UPI00110C57B6|nr:FAD/NAD(P)-binding protein [Nonomuraea basaltis]TMR94219.1 FAD/NAD(P)-binding protein [Nonomuraea basaltis]